jgi:DNA-binding CsgD family transcriptional regulator
MKTRALPLTPRQTEVVRLVSLGCTNEEAANILGLAVSTVDNHKAAAMRMLGTDKATLLTRIAIKNKITKLDETLTASEKRKSGRKNDGWN